MSYQCTFSKEKARGLARGQEASAALFVSLKRPGGHVARGLTKLCVRPFLPAAPRLKRAIAMMMKSEHDYPNYGDNDYIEPIACLSTRLTYSLSWVLEVLSGPW